LLHPLGFTKVGERGFIELRFMTFWFSILDIEFFVIIYFNIKIFLRTKLINIHIICIDGRRCYFMTSLNFLEFLLLHLCCLSYFFFLNQIVIPIRFHFFIFPSIFDITLFRFFIHLILLISNLFIPLTKCQLCHFSIPKTFILKHCKSFILRRKNSSNLFKIKYCYLYFYLFDIY
jgi:hypothetical protein